jgi:hypothetical protein
MLRAAQIKQKSFMRVAGGGKKWLARFIQIIIYIVQNAFIEIIL